MFTTRTALAAVAALVLGGAIGGGLIAAALTAPKADEVAVDDQIESVDEKARMAAEKALANANHAQRLAAMLAEAEAEIVTVTRDVRAAGIEGDPGESIEGPEGPPGESVVGPAGESIVGPQGEPGETVVGPEGPQGPQGPAPTQAELMNVLAAYIATAEGAQQIRSLINGFACTAPPPDFVVTC